MDIPVDLDALSTEQICELNAKLMAEIAEKETELQYRQTRIDQLTHELSVIKRQQFGKRSEQLNKEQVSLLEEALDADLAAIGLELQGVKSGGQAGTSRRQPKRVTSHPYPTSGMYGPDAFCKPLVTAWKSGLRRQNNKLSTSAK